MSADRPRGWRRTAEHVASQTERVDDAPDAVPAARVDDFARVVAALDDGLDGPDEAREEIARALDTRSPTLVDMLDVVADGTESFATVCERAGVEADDLDARLAGEFEDVGVDPETTRTDRRWVVWNHLGRRDDDDRRAIQRSLRHLAWRHDDRPVEPFGWSRPGTVADHLDDRLGPSSPELRAALETTLYDHALEPPEEAHGSPDRRVFETARRVLDRPVAEEAEESGADTAASLIEEFGGQLPAEDRETGGAGEEAGTEGRESAETDDGWDGDGRGASG